MSDVLDRVAGFRIVVKGWSGEFLRELTLQDLFRERGVINFNSCMFRSTIELQFCLLDPPLNQLIESLYVRELLDPHPSLAALSPRSETR